MFYFTVCKIWAGCRDSNPRYSDPPPGVLLITVATQMLDAHLLLLVLLLVELLKVLRDDGDGEGHHQDPGYSAERADQLTQP